MGSPVSTPQPAAERPGRLERGPGQAALAVQGQAGAQPVARLMPAPDRPITKPWPRLTRSLNTAIVMSAWPRGPGHQGGPRGGLSQVAVEEEQMPGAVRPFPRAAGLPRPGLQGRALAPVGNAGHDRARCFRHAAVSSRDPSSTT